MSGAQKVAFWFWIVIVSVLVLLATYFMSAEVTYSATEVGFDMGINWDMEIFSEKPINIRAGDESYYLFRQGKEFLDGELEPPPLDYGHDTYYYLESQIPNGTWKAVKGNDIEIELSSDKPIQVSLYTTGDGILENFAIALVGGFVIWLIVFLIGAAFFSGRDARQADET